jgi:hypothetical protein
MHNAGEEAIFARCIKQKATEIPLEAQICFGKSNRFPAKDRRRKQCDILSTPAAVAGRLYDICCNTGAR